MITLDKLDEWIEQPSENEHLEFKEAKLQYSVDKLLRYCVAFANERGGYLILGVSDKRPRKIVGTSAFPNVGEIKSQVLNKLHFRVETHELQHRDGRVLVFEIPSRPVGQPLHFDGMYLMRMGEELVPMNPEHLRGIFSESESSWFKALAKSHLNTEDIPRLLDTQAFFDMMKLPYPTSQQLVLERLVSEGLISKHDNTWSITNLAAILLAKHLSDFSHELERKAPRTIIYKGNNKLETIHDRTDTKGYAVLFNDLIEFVYSLAPQNHFVEEAIRQEVKMYPMQALRELIANALVHQDFQISGVSPVIEVYSDRVEISNPGIPPIEVNRFIDEYRSRNEILANFMRRFGICEEKGSGIDKVIALSELYQLPAPDFRVGKIHTTAILFAHQDFSDMNKTDRVRACYQHCCLHYISNQRMTNQSLRERFRLPTRSMPTVSLLISSVKEMGLIKLDDSDTQSSRYAKYIPYWA